jgi:quercetin dioxygenase-like cupin family protein
MSVTSVARQLIASHLVEGTMLPGSEIGGRAFGQPGTQPDHGGGATHTSAGLSTTILEHTIAGLPGLQFSVVRVRYAPGESGGPHHHTAPLVAYVVSGALRSSVGDGPERVYQAGDSFYEPPDAVHHVSANASATEPVTFIAVFVAPANSVLTVPHAR